MGERLIVGRREYRARERRAVGVWVLHLIWVRRRRRRDEMKLVGSDARSDCPLLRSSDRVRTRTEARLEMEAPSLRQGVG
jgi:hypothetical protein